jgi:hypothetical protein
MGFDTLDHGGFRRINHSRCASSRGVNHRHDFVSPQDHSYQNDESNGSSTQRLQKR